MPTWALIYCGLIILGTIGGLFSKDRIRTSYQPIGEIVCGVCGLYIFAAAFDLYEIDKSLPTLMFTFGFVNFWFFHAHRHNFKYGNARQYIHNQNMKLDEQRKRELGDDFVPEYSFEKSEKETRFYFVFISVGSFLFYLPFAYAFWLCLEAIIH